MAEAGARFARLVLWGYAAQVVLIGVPVTCLGGLLALWGTLAGLLGTLFPGMSATPSAPWWAMLPILALGLCGTLGLIGWWRLSIKFLAGGRTGLRKAHRCWWVFLWLGICVAIAPVLYGLFARDGRLSAGDASWASVLQTAMVGPLLLLPAAELLVLRRWGGPGDATEVGTGNAAFDAAGVRTGQDDGGA